MRIVEELDDDEDKLLFVWEREGLDGLDVVIVVVVVVEVDDDKGRFDGIGCFNAIEVNDDGLTSESIEKQRITFRNHKCFLMIIINRKYFVVLLTINITKMNVTVCCYLIQYLLNV